MATTPPQKQGQSFGTQAPDPAQVALEINAFEEELAKLKARFEQFFLGLERINPTPDYEAYKKRLLKLKNQFHRNTAVKFRLGTLHNKFITYERLWLKTLKDIEEGRYVRDLKKLKRKNELKKQKDPPKDEQQAAGAEEPKKDEKLKQKGVYTLEDLEADLPDELFGEAFTSPAKPPPPPSAARPPPPPPQAAARPPPPPAAAAAARPPPPPAAASRPPPPPGAARPPPPPAAARPATVGGLSDEKISQIYNAYVTAKRRCKESTDGITPDALARSLRQQVPKLMEQHGAKAVDFKVVIKDGKAVLKAVPK